MKTLDQYGKNRVLYIIEAAVEYFISLLITDAFLATLLTRSGVSDADTGVITQLASLSFIAQLFSVFVRRNRGMKRWITIMHLINQLMYVSLYMIPIIEVPGSVKVACFVVMFLGGHIIANIVSPYKLSWFMSFVPDNTRGRFTANKEIVSLIGGMVFSFCMGSLVDYMQSIGREDLGFQLCGITIFVLAMLHLGSLLLVKDKEPEITDEPVSHVSLRTVAKTLTNKTLLKIILVDVIWHFATGISVSFYGTYKINELGFSLQFVSIISILYSISRVIFSRFFGKFADKYSWTKMLTVCFAIASLAYCVNMFTVPSNGKVMFTLYYCIYAVSMAGINSGLMNIIFDFVPHNDRAAALGIKYAVGGSASFLAALVGRSILSHIQGNGNTLLGMNLYAQQVLSAIAFILCILLVVYMRVVIVKLKTVKDKE
ncbi:MAG: MFS transporter [Clostridia bacterium]|nr:MFS transporter [Clostridia bacterium]